MGRTARGRVEKLLAELRRPSWMKTECDFSGVLWLVTINRLSGIASALLTRSRVLVLRQPGPEHREVIARNVFDDVAARWGVDRQVLPELGDLDLPLDGLSSARQVRLAV